MALLDRDGNAYTTVVIGSQEWIVENFKCTKYANGEDIYSVDAVFDDWFLLEFARIADGRKLYAEVWYE
jgi:hypothetical protein